jgi:iron transport multicopper oxidase
MTRLIASLLALGTLVSAELVELWWNVSYALANPDGRHLRRVIGVNGTWP